MFWSLTTSTPGVDNLRNDADCALCIVASSSPPLYVNPALCVYSVPLHWRAPALSPPLSVYVHIMVHTTAPLQFPICVWLVTSRFNRTPGKRVVLAEGYRIRSRTRYTLWFTLGSARLETCICVAPLPTFGYVGYLRHVLTQNGKLHIHTGPVLLSSQQARC